MTSLSSQSNTQAAWWNRIPAEAWVLMGLIAILCNLMIGVSARHLEGRSVFLVLPLVMAIAFFSSPTSIVRPVAASFT
jgi:hypothetical protein